MSENVVKPATFEQLPVEIFFDIFEYIGNIWKVYNRFYGLNRQIDSLLANAPNLHLQLNRREDIQNPIVTFFATHITRLVVNSWEFSDLSPFINIRALKIYILPDTVFSQLFQTPGRFLNLEYLSIGYQMLIYKETTAHQVIRHIFSSQEFPRLHTCFFGRITLNDILLTDRFLSLRSLNIRTSNFLVYFRVLVSCPLLNKLEMIGYDETPTSFSHQNDQQHLLLRRLILSPRSFPTDGKQFDLMLSCTPNLTHLIIINPYRTPIEVEHLQRLSRILTRRTSHLRYFVLNTDLTYQASDITEIAIRQMHPLFVNSEFNSSNRGLGAHLLISTSLPSRVALQRLINDSN